MSLAVTKSYRTVTIASKTCILVILATHCAFQHFALTASIRGPRITGRDDVPSTCQPPANLRLLAFAAKQRKANHGMIPSEHSSTNHYRITYN